MAGILGEYTEIFLEESEDQIEELNNNLLLLEKNHTNIEIINDIFRAAHSLKSSSAFVGLYNLSELAHKMENLLQKIREGSLDVNINLVNILFKCFDLIKKVITDVSNGKKIDMPYTSMIQELENYDLGVNNNQDSQTFSSPEAVSKKRNESSINSKSKNSKQPIDLATKPKSSKVDALLIQSSELFEIYEKLESNNSLKAYKIKIVLKKDTPMIGLRLTLILQNLKNQGIIFKSKPSEEELGTGKSSSTLYLVYLSSKGEGEICELTNVDMVETLNVIQLKLPPKPSTQSSNEKSESSDFQSNNSDTIHSGKPTTNISNPTINEQSLSSNSDNLLSDSKIVLKSIKVSSDKLDQLMNNVGELVITNSGFQKIYDDLVHSFGEDILFNELKSKIDQINRISKELQTGIMNIRMVPIGTVFNRFSRLVRDLALETGKEIELVLRGESTELDKKVIDALGEPLIHLVRNSVDHGIETMEERKKKGKSPVGTVELNAYQGGSNIMVEIRDDGRGLKRKKLLDKAIEKGLVSEEEGSKLTDSEVYQFIFTPGFSTAEKITDISGRGVGMSVVNKLVQEFKGKILINTQEGVGSSFTLSFPQALAIIPSILVVMEEEVYAFPLSEVSETIKVNQNQITTLEGHEIINLRGEVLPIYWLSKIIGLAKGEAREELPVVIVTYKTRKLGFIVDDLIGKHETVIKSLAKNFQNVQGLTGATIMGDGTIILVLDIPGLVEIASSDELKDSAELGGEMMKRISTVQSLESSDSDSIFKTRHATNLFNSKLNEMRSIDKSKFKKHQVKIKKVEMDNFDEKITILKDESIRAIKNEDQSGKIGEIGLNDNSSHNQLLGKVENNPNYAINFSNQSKTQNYENKLELEESNNLISSDPTNKSSDLLSHLESKLGDVEEEDKKKAKEIIKGFIEQKNERLQAIHSFGTKEFEELLNKDQLRKLETIMNTGMMNAAMVLSQLLSKEVELFVPEINLTDKDGLAKEFRYSNENFFGMKIRMNGDLNGNLLMMFSEENGKEVASSLLSGGEFVDGSLSDDSISVLGEIANIVCSGVINSLSNKTKTEILPSVPEFITGKFTEVLDLVKPERTKFLTMHTEFNQGGNNLLGTLLFLPDFDELVRLISKI